MGDGLSSRGRTGRRCPPHGRRPHHRRPRRAGPPLRQGFAKYTSLAFGAAADIAGLQPSFGRTGDAYDNAAMETVWSTIKREIPGSETRTPRQGDVAWCNLVSMPSPEVTAVLTRDRWNTRGILLASMLTFAAITVPANADPITGSSNDCGTSLSDAQYMELIRQVSGSGEQAELSESRAEHLGAMQGVMGVVTFDNKTEILTERGLGAKQLVAIRGAVEAPVGPGVESLVLESCLTTGEIHAASERLSALSLKDSDFMLFGYEPLVDRYVVVTNLPEEIVKSNLELSPDEIVVVAVPNALFKPAAGSRLNDYSPHWAGAQISSPAGICTSGFSVVKAGTRYSTTAGHCPNASYVSGAYSFSTSYTRAASYPSTDAALLGGSTYHNRSYSANDNVSNKPVTVKADPQNGFVYCQYGSQSKRRCFTQSASGQTICFADGCRLNISSANSTSSQSYSIPGDSGGPIVKEFSTYLGARGLIVGNGLLTFDGTTYYYIYYHKISSVESALGATVVLG